MKKKSEKIRLKIEKKKLKKKKKKKMKKKKLKKIGNSYCLPHTIG